MRENQVFRITHRLDCTGFQAVVFCTLFVQDQVGPWCALLRSGSTFGRLWLIKWKEANLIWIFLWVQPMKEGVTLQSWTVEYPFGSEHTWCLSVNAGNAFPALLSDIPKINSVFSVLGCCGFLVFFVEVVLDFSTLKSIKQFLKSKASWRNL